MSLQAIEPLALQSLHSGVDLDEIFAVCGVTSALREFAELTGWEHTHIVSVRDTKPESLAILGYIEQEDLFGRDYVFGVPVDERGTYSNRDADRLALRGLYKRSQKLNHQVEDVLTLLLQML